MYSQPTKNGDPQKANARINEFLHRLANRRNLDAITTKRKSKMKKANRTKASLRLSSYLTFNGTEKSSPTAVGGRQAEISAKGRHKIVHPSPPCLTLWWIEPGELVRSTPDPRPVKLGADHCVHNASERLEAVQPHSRPLSDTGARDRDTTGSRKDCRQERVEQDGDLNGRRNGAD